MADAYVVLKAGRQQLLLGEPRHFPAARVPHSKISQARQVLARVAHDPREVEKLQAYLQQHSGLGLSTVHSGHATTPTAAADAALSHGRLLALVMEVPVASPAAGKITLPSEAGPLGERFRKVFQLAKARAPASIMADIEELTSDESILNFIVFSEIVAAAHMTGFGPEFDAFVLGLVYYYGGLKALVGAFKLGQFLGITLMATTESRLEQAADLLIEALKNITAGVILRMLSGRIATSRPGAGAGGAAAKEDASAAYERPAMNEPRPVPKAVEAEPVQSLPKTKSEILDDMYVRAAKGKQQIDALSRKIAGEYNGKVAEAPLKGRARAMQKIDSDYGGDPTRIKDLARNTIIVDEEQIASVTADLEKAGVATSRIAPGADPCGYTGAKGVLKTEAGISAEIQVNSPEMIYGKESEAVARQLLGDAKYDAIAAKTGVPGGQGHVLYEEYRTLPPDSPEAGAIAARSRAYYDAVRGGK